MTDEETTRLYDPRKVRMLVLVKRCLLVALLLTSFACEAEPPVPTSQQLTRKAVHEAQGVADVLNADESARAADAVGRGVTKTGAAGARAVGEELEGSEGAARSLGKGLGTSVKGFVEGIDEAVQGRPKKPSKDGKFNIVADESALNGGLNVQFGALDSSKEKASVYIVFSSPFDGRLELRVEDDQGREVGRAYSAVKVEPTGGYVDFEFERGLLGPAKYTLSVTPTDP